MPMGSSCQLELEHCQLAVRQWGIEIDFVIRQRCGKNECDIDPVSCVSCMEELVYYRSTMECYGR